MKLHNAIFIEQSVELSFRSIAHNVAGCFARVRLLCL
jgi:hypothetical protein